MIEFEFENSPKKELTLAVVECDQFFIDIEGFLCQKVNHESYIMIANKAGYPFAQIEHWGSEPCPILKILPKVTSIKF